MPSAREFLEASLTGRAKTLLVDSFNDPLESISRINMANAVAGAHHGGSSAVSFGAVPAGTDRDARSQVFRSVSEAWQLLERAGLICRDLEQPSGDWWALTNAGGLARESDDVVAAIRNAAGG